MIEAQPDLDIETAMGMFGAAKYADMPPNPSVIFGGYKEAIDASWTQWRQDFLKEFGVEPSDTLTQRPYTRSDAERGADARLAWKALVRRAELQGGVPKTPPNTSFLTYVSETASDMRRQAFERSMPPNLSESLVVADSLNQHLLDLTNTNTLVGLNEADCVLYALLAYAPIMHGIRNARIKRDFAVRSLRNRGFPDYAIHDLHAMLHSLSGPHRNFAVSTRLTVGMGLPEINERFVQPLVQKIPDLCFGITLLAGSEKVIHSNHAYVLKGGRQGIPIVYDAQSNTPNQVLNTESLARRWYATGMQAGIIVVHDGTQATDRKSRAD